MSAVSTGTGCAAGIAPAAGPAVRPRDAAAEPQGAAASWAFGPYRLLACGTLLDGVRIVPLTPKEENVLRALVGAGGRRLSKDELVAAAWGDTPVSDASLARAIHTLRRKLVDGPGGVDCIRTTYGRGYQISVPVSRAE
jgi:DNA-binding winged helix-turn-helix (wHTH) protein